MLQHLLIRDFAIIENTEIEFQDGLNVITGETGSGKSIVIEAVSLALGSRADSSFVRNGKSKAVIQLAATLDGEEYIITREISAAGKNLCKLNGQLVSLGEISSLAKRIADIHGQYDNQRLLDPEHHLVLVDQFHQEEIQPLREAFDAAYHAYKDARSKLENLRASIRESQKMADFYRFSLNEIEGAHLTPGEDASLTERIRILENSEKIYAAVAEARALLAGGEENGSGVLSALGQMQTALSPIADYSTEISDTTATISDALYRLGDVSNLLISVQEKTIFDPQELDRAIARLDLIDHLKEKYAEDSSSDGIQSILNYADFLAEELDHVENFDLRQSELEGKCKECLATLKQCAETLTQARKVSASELTASIERELRDLKFADAKLDIAVVSASAITASGADAIDFLISTNKGEPLKPLVRIASGGEISRIMLAIKKITGEYDHIPTMIFDEIDAGISGITASVVGRKLSEISKTHQVVCITHLPQIAACGSSNYRIFKETDTESTFTHVQRLGDAETIDEIARLLGGEYITDTTRRSAKELWQKSHQDI